MPLWCCSKRLGADYEGVLVATVSGKPQFIRITQESRDSDDDEESRTATSFTFHALDSLAGLFEFECVLCIAM